MPGPPAPAAPAAPAGPPPAARRGGSGLRREVPVLLPIALLLLLALSAFTLLSYRNALLLLAEERRGEAARLAQAFAAEAERAGGGAGELQRLVQLPALAPVTRGVVVLDAAGRARASSGEVPPAPLAPLGGRLPSAPLARGPNADVPGAVAGFAPLAGGGAVRVDLAASLLHAQLRALRLLLFVVLAADAAVLALVVVFLNRLLAPFETLLARARQVGEPDGGDEVEFLLATFEQARAALAAREGSAEDDLAALERTLTASLQSGLLLLDREGRVLALNGVGADLLGTSAPSPGAALAEVLAGQPELNDLLATAIAGGQGIRREECAVRSESRLGSEVRTVGLTLHPLRRDDGEVRGHLVLFADLTEARRDADEARLAESLTRLGEMAGGMAHELRNSLATLSGYLTLLERRPDEETVADYMAEIRRESDHLQRVLDDFLAFARPGSVRMRDFELAPWLRRAAADPVLAGVAVALGPVPPGTALRGDPQLLERALRNLLHNAAEAHRAADGEGPVEVAVEPGDDGGLDLVVADRGRGLPAQVRERLFHPFATGRAGGVGLGLALAHRIVVLHGGRLRLDDRPGGGTLARIVLPREALVSPPPS
jgi:signal transduction histidine kinase